MGFPPLSNLKLLRRTRECAVLTRYLKCVPLDVTGTSPRQVTQQLEPDSSEETYKSELLKYSIVWSPSDTSSRKE